MADVRKDVYTVIEGVRVPVEPSIGVMRGGMRVVRPRNYRKRVVYSSDRPSLVKAEFQKESDINEIMKKYKRGNLAQFVDAFGDRYGDFISAPDFMNMQIAIAEAQQMFDMVPASIRKMFGNDARDFLEFVQNPENKDDLKDLGLLREPVAPGATLDDVVKELKASAAERSVAKPPSEPPTGA